MVDSKIMLMFHYSSITLMPLNRGMPKQIYIIFEVPKDFNIADGVLMIQNG